MIKMYIAIKWHVFSANVNFFSCKQQLETSPVEEEEIVELSKVM